jgi:hypothetical protein
VYAKKVFLFFALALFVSSCAARLPIYAPDVTNPVYTVAVLPFYNATNDVGGAEALRLEFHRRIARRHYNAIPLKEVDELLYNRMGITLGSQLELTDAVELGRTLGVDALVYGYVLDFDDVTTGLYNVKKVRAGFKLVDALTGETIWTGGQGVKSVISGGGKLGAGVSVVKELGEGADTELFAAIKGLEEVEGIGNWQIIRAAPLNKIEEAAMISLGETLITKAFGVHLRLESNTMLDLAMRGFPIGPGFEPQE